jgi:dipeptidase E
MKLYLSSLGIPNSRAFRSLMGSGSKKIGVISNAWDVYPSAKSGSYIQALFGNLEELGFIWSEIDLRAFLDDHARLRSRLDELDGVWVTGGNVFYLNWLFHKSGFNRLIKPLLESGVVYGGESAGAVVACPTLSGAQFIDDTREAPEVIWEGLGLIDFAIVPHWGREKYGHLLDRFHQEAARHAPVELLKDDQAIIMDGSSLRRIG